MQDDTQKKKQKKIILEDLEKAITHSRPRPNTKPPSSRTTTQSDENRSTNQSNSNSSTEE